MRASALPLYLLAKGWSGPVVLRGEDDGCDVFDQVGGCAEFGEIVAREDGALVFVVLGGGVVDGVVP